MPDVTEYESRFRAVDLASPILSSIAGKATVAGDAIRGVQTIMGVGFSAYGQVSGYLRQIVGIQSAFEGMKLNVAGTLRAYGLAGETMQSINQRARAGLVDFATASQSAFRVAENVATGTLTRIEEQAARLPGTAEDYLQVFQDSLGSMSRTHFSNVGAFAEFTSNFAATAVANRIDAGQAGRDLNLMLQGMAGMDVRTWRLLQPLIHRTETSTENVTTQMFNRWSGQQRSKAIERALRLYQPLLAQIGDTWEAQVGTFQSFKRTLVRNTTEPIFRVLSESLGVLNTGLASASASLTAIGNVAAGHVAKGMRHAVDAAKNLYEWVSRTGSAALQSGWFASLVGGAATAGRTAYGAVSGMLGNRSGQLGALAMVGGPTMGAVAAFLTHTDAVSETMRHLYGVLGPVIGVIESVHGIYSTIATTGGAVLATVIPKIAEFAQVVATAAANVAAVLANEVGNIAAAWSPVISTLATFVAEAFATAGGGVRGATPTLVDAIVTTSGVIQSLGTSISELRETVNSVTGPFREFGVRLGDVYTYLNRFTPGGAAAYAGEQLERATGVSGSNAVRGAISSVGSTLMRMTDDLSELMPQHGRRRRTDAEREAQFNANEEFMNRLVGFGRQAYGGRGAPSLGQAHPSVGAPANPEEAGRRIVASIEEAINRAGKNAAIASMEARSATGGTNRPTPSQRPSGAYNDFRYSRFDINQRFAEGFDPDRIAAVFASDLEAMAEQKLSGGFVPVMSAAG